jgi:hypothetical protein
VTLLANTALRPIRIRVDNLFGFTPPSMAAQLIFLAMVFVGTVALSRFLRRNISSGDPGSGG